MQAFSSRLKDTLLRQEGESDPEIRALSLATLNDDDLLSLAALFWTQLGWGSALAASGWVWIVVPIAAEIALFLARWQMRRGRTLMGRPLGAPSAERSVSMNLALIAFVSLNVLILALAPSDRTAILAITLATGFAGYVAALFTVFPVLATLNIVMLFGSMGLGLAVGPSDLARPFAILALAGIGAFWLLLRRTHLSVIGNIRGHRASHLLSLHDPLTKLPNRTFMRDALARYLAAMDPQDDGRTQVAVLCLDLDGFKAINDRFGHAAGDWVLVHVAEILRAQMTPGGDACRIGGDEYVLLLPGADEDKIRSLGRSIIAALTKPFDIGRTIPANIGVSIGAAIAKAGGCQLDDLLEQADAALYAAKRAGRGQLVLNSDRTIGADAPLSA